MNPKDEVKFEDVKKLVNAGLEKFYKNDRDLLEDDEKYDMVEEQCMVFHIAGYMKTKMRRLAKFQWADIDCEYNRNLKDPKMMSLMNGNSRRIIPDLIIHRRRSHDNNLFVAEFKKYTASSAALEKDRQKLMYMTDQEKEYKYNFGFLIELGEHEVHVDVYQEGNLQTKLSYSIVY